MKTIQGSYITGYVTVLVQGDMPELFFQQCINYEIPVWNIKKINPNKCIGNIKYEHVKQLEDVNQNGTYKIAISKQSGIPFIIKRMMKKIELLIALTCSILLIIFLSNIVWKIEVSGLPKDLEKMVHEQLTSYGIYPGAWTFTIDNPSVIQQQLLHDIPELLWVGVDKKGTTFYLEGVEKLIVKKEKSKKPQHLVASKKGVIKKIFVSKGVPQVFVNDFVEKGDLLVSGILQNDSLEDEGNEENDSENKSLYISAEGEVIANTWYEVKVTIPLKTNFEQLTGNQQKKYLLGLGNYQIPIWNVSSPGFKSFQVENNAEPIRFFKWNLPIKIVESVISEKTEANITRTKQEAIQTGIEQAKRELQLQLGSNAKIISEKVLHESTENGKVKLTLYVTVEEDIVKSQPIQKKP